MKETAPAILPAETALAAPARATTALTLALLNLLLYLFCLLALLVVGGLIVADIALLVVLARCYASRLMLPPLQRLFRLTQVIVRSLRLEPGAEYHLRVQEADAPALFALIRDCARQVGGVELAEIALGMTDAAWVRMEGYRQGRGKSTLCLGFDLLTTLSEPELRAVVLHEMAHARLVQRGLNNWTRKGAVRGNQLAMALRSLVQEESERKGKSKRAQLWSAFWTAQLLAGLAFAIARAEARLYAAYSRQDEFIADQVSARIGGAQTFRRALLKTVLIDLKGQRLRWVDRVVQSQREESYTAWLRAQLLPTDAEEAARLEREAFAQERRSPFDTHPTLEDRFAHIDAPSAATTTPASTVLPEAAPFAWADDPDALAERLFDRIERVQAEEERKESEALSRWERQHRRQSSRAMTGLEWAGVLLIILDVVVLLFVVAALASGDIPAFAVLLTIFALLLGLGIWTYRRGTPRGPAFLPIPEYTVWEDSFRAARNDDAARTLAGLPDPPDAARKAERLRYWSERGYDALAACEYTRALACGQRCIEIQKRSAEGLLLAGVAQSCLGRGDAGDRHLVQVRQTYSANPWVYWAVAWACMAGSHYAVAEAHLLGAIERLPPHPTLFAALGVAQAQRGKTRAAIANLRQAVALAPDSARLRLRLAQTLLGAGKAREASAELAALERQPTAQDDRDVRLAQVRAHLLLDHRELAETQARLVAAQHPCPETWYLLGVSYAKADHYEEAAAYLHQATTEALYPAAWVGLGAIYAHQKQPDHARACYLGALNLFHPLAPEAEGPLDALSAALDGLRALREPATSLRPWEARLDVRSLPAFRLAELHLFLLARDRSEALAYIHELLAAMHPGAPEAERLLLRLDLAEVEPPDGPAEPGILDWRGMSLPQPGSM